MKPVKPLKHRHSRPVYPSNPSVGTDADSPDVLLLQSVKTLNGQEFQEKRIEILAAECGFRKKGSAIELLRVVMQIIEDLDSDCPEQRIELTEDILMKRDLDMQPHSLGRAKKKLLENELLYNSPNRDSYFYNVKLSSAKKILHLIEVYQVAD